MMAEHRILDKSEAGAVTVAPIFANGGGDDLTAKFFPASTSGRKEAGAFLIATMVVKTGASPNFETKPSTSGRWFGFKICGVSSLGHLENADL